MNARETLTCAVSLVLLVACLGVSRVAIADDAADVILTIEEQWQAVQEGKEDWIDERLHEKFSGWPANSPAPRSKLSAAKWNRFFATQGRLVEHELYFQNIVVDGDVAVAHYFFTSANEDNNGEVEIDNGRYTDVLVRTDDGWKFLAWHGGETD
jgi:hypothetical protein